MDCGFCYYPNDDGARFCVRCAASLGVPVETLPSQPPPAPAEDELRAADALGQQLGRSGAVLDGRYRLLRCLGSGGFGAVFEAEEIDTSLRVAVKLLNRSALVDVRMRERFLQEARMIAELKSPHVVRLYDYAVNGRTPYLVLELVSGQNLANLLMRGVLPARRVLRILAQVTAALGEAHALGIVHRDIKPDNILLTEQGSQEDFVKVIDFGVARLRGVSTQPSDVLGTPAFISPETLANEPVDGRCDLYAVGVLLWQAIIGELPFPSANQAVMMSSPLQAQRRRPSEVYPHLRGRLPPQLETLMTRLIARYPIDRPASAYEVRTELLSLVPLASDVALASAPMPNFGPGWDPAPPENSPENPSSNSRDILANSALTTRKEVPRVF